VNIFPNTLPAIATIYAGTTFGGSMKVAFVIALITATLNAAAQRVARAQLGLGRGLPHHCR